MSVGFNFEREKLEFQQQITLNATPEHKTVYERLTALISCKSENASHKLHLNSIINRLFERINLDTFDPSFTPSKISKFVLLQNYSEDDLHSSLLQMQALWIKKFPSICLKVLIYVLKKKLVFPTHLYEFAGPLSRTKCDKYLFKLAKVYIKLSKDASYIQFINITDESLRLELAYYILKISPQNFHVALNYLRIENIDKLTSLLYSALEYQEYLVWTNFSTIAKLNENDKIHFLTQSFIRNPSDTLRSFSQLKLNLSYLIDVMIIYDYKYDYCGFQFLETIFAENPEKALEYAQIFIKIDTKSILKSSIFTIFDEQLRYELILQCINNPSSDLSPKIAAKTLSNNLYSYNFSADYFIKILDLIGPLLEWKLTNILQNLDRISDVQQSHKILIHIGDKTNWKDYKSVWRLANSLKVETQDFIYKIVLVNFDFINKEVKIRNLSQEVQTKILELVLQKDPHLLCSKISNFNIACVKKWEEYLQKVGEACNWRGVPLHYFNILDKKVLFEAAKKIAAADENFPYQMSLLAFSFVKRNALAMISAKKSGTIFLTQFNHFSITDYSSRVKLAEICATHYGAEFANHIEAFELDKFDQPLLQKLADMAGKQCNWKIGSFFHKFSIRCREYLLPRLRRIAEVDASNLILNIDRYQMLDPDDRLYLFRLYLDQINWKSGFQCIYRCHFSGEEKHILIAKEALIRNPIELLRLFGSFKIYDQDALFEIAYTLAGIKLPDDVEFNFLQFNIKCERRKILIAERFLETNDWRVETFGIKNQAFIEKVANKYIEIHGPAFFNTFSDLYILDEDKRYQAVIKAGRKGKWENAIDCIESFKFTKKKYWFSILQSLAFYRADELKTKILQAIYEVKILTGSEFGRENKKILRSMAHHCTESFLNLSDYIPFDIISYIIKTFLNRKIPFSHHFESLPKSFLTAELFCKAALYDVNLPSNIGCCVAFLNEEEKSKIFLAAAKLDALGAIKNWPSPNSIASDARLKTILLAYAQDIDDATRLDIQLEQNEIGNSSLTFQEKALLNFIYQMKNPVSGGSDPKIAIQFWIRLLETLLSALNIEYDFSKHSTLPFEIMFIHIEHTVKSVLYLAKKDKLLANWNALSNERTLLLQCAKKLNNPLHYESVAKFSFDILNSKKKSAFLLDLKEKYSYNYLLIYHILFSTLICSTLTPSKLMHWVEPLYKLKHLLKDATLIKAFLGLVQYFNSMKIASEIVSRIFDLIFHEIDQNSELKPRDIKYLLIDRFNLIRQIGQLGGMEVLNNHCLPGEISKWNSYFTDIFRAKVPIRERDNFNECYSKVILSSRNPSAICQYAGSLNTLTDKKMRNDALTALARFVDNLLDGSDVFKARRMDENENPILKTAFAFNPDFKKIWSGNIEMEFDASLEDTDEEPFNLKDFLKTKIEHDKHISLPLVEEFLHSTQNKLESEQLILETDNDRCKAEKLILTMFTDSFVIMTKEEKVAHIDRIAKLLSLKTIDPFFNDLKELKAYYNPKILDENLKLVFTDNPFDLLLCGTDVLGSCQNINGNPEYNVGLLGYLLRGNIKIIGLKNKQNTFVARALIRVLLDHHNRPVLLLSRIYSTGHKKYVKAICHIAKHLSEKLDISLYSQTVGKGTFYLHSLKSLKGQSPFEYSDEVSGNSVTDGEYSVRATHKIIE